MTGERFTVPIKNNEIPHLKKEKSNTFNNIPAIKSALAHICYCQDNPDIAMWGKLCLVASLLQEWLSKAPDGSLMTFFTGLLEITCIGRSNYHIGPVDSIEKL